MKIANDFIIRTLMSLLLLALPWGIVLGKIDLAELTFNDLFGLIWLTSICTGMSAAIYFSHGHSEK